MTDQTDRSDEHAALPVYDPRAIDWQQIERLRRMQPQEKVLMGLRLQEMARLTMLAGIRAQFPQAGDDEVHRIFMERITRRR